MRYFTQTPTVLLAAYTYDNCLTDEDTEAYRGHSWESHVVWAVGLDDALANSSVSVYGMDGDGWRLDSEELSVIVQAWDLLAQIDSPQSTSETWSHKEVRLPAEWVCLRGWLRFWGVWTGSEQAGFWLTLPWMATIFISKNNIYQH